MTLTVREDLDNVAMEQGKSCVFHQPVQTSSNQPSYSLFFPMQNLRKLQEHPSTEETKPSSSSPSSTKQHHKRPCTAEPSGVRRKSVTRPVLKSLSLSDIESAIRDEIPFLDTVVDHSKLFEGARKVVLELFPHWNADDLKLVQYQEGITNKLVKVTHTTPVDGNDALAESNRRKNIVLVRAYGKKSELLIDRHQEILNIVTLSKLGLCPPLYGRFTNGLAYGYVPGRVCTPQDMMEPETSSAIAKSLALWHSVKAAGDHQPKLFDTLWKWLGEVPTGYSDASKDTLFKARFHRDKLRDELEILQKHLETFNAPVVFCHCDLLAANIIYDDQKKEANFIDYEYGTWSYRGFDIGNHWNEWAGFECDYTRFPDRTRAISWIKNYMGNRDVPEIELDTLYREGCKFALASHFYWGLWALVQADVSDIDFNYMNYAVLRFDEYERRKEEFFRL